MEESMSVAPKRVKEKIAGNDKPRSGVRRARGDAVFGSGTGSKPKAPDTIYGRMSRLLGETLATEADVVKIVNTGLPSTALTRLIDEGYAVELRMIGAETTMRRRIQEKQTLTVEESERLVRIARVTSLAEDLFGTKSAAIAWLNTRSNYVSNEETISPLELATTDPGARMVEAMIARTAHGIF
jgi:putative toxin-antitoxin system antitoxin component (TIGR02293 family)